MWTRGNPDISDYECDADDLLLMPIIIPQFDLQVEFSDLDSEDSEGEETGKDITGTDIILREFLYFQN
jgi:hypothetical protein